MGAGKGGEIMKIIGAIIALLLWLFICFVSMSHAQDLFDLAETEFDIDYIDIAGIEIFGNKRTGQVIAVWMKNGDVLTKTLLNSNAKNSDDDDVSYSYERVSDRNGADPDGGEAVGDSWQPSELDDENLHEVYNYEDNDYRPYPTFLGKSTDELIEMARDIINKPEWTYNYKWSNSYSEELDLCRILDQIKYADAKGEKVVQLTMDIISADLEHGQKPGKLYLEKSKLLIFAEGDEKLIKQANEFLENNGFNKEKE